MTSEAEMETDGKRTEPRLRGKQTCKAESRANSSPEGRWAQMHSLTQSYKRQ